LSLGVYFLGGLKGNTGIARFNIITVIINGKIHSLIYL